MLLRGGKRQRASTSWIMGLMRRSVRRHDLRTSNAVFALASWPCRSYAGELPAGTVYRHELFDEGECAPPKSSRPFSEPSVRPESHVVGQPHSRAPRTGKTDLPAFNCLSELSVRALPIASSVGAIRRAA